MEQVTIENGQVIYNLYWQAPIGSPMARWLLQVAPKSTIENRISNRKRGTVVNGIAMLDGGN